MFIVTNRKGDELQRSGIRFRTLMPLLRSSHLLFPYYYKHWAPPEPCAAFSSACSRLEPGAPSTTRARKRGPEMLPSVPCSLPFPDNKGDRPDCSRR